MAEVLTYICPFCESEVRVGGQCGKCQKKAERSASKKKSWEQEPSYDGLDLPDDDFDYDDFVKKEFGAAPHQRVSVQWYWWVLAIGALLAMAAVSFWIG